jgi:serine/threonine protein phosphatase 1
MRTFVIGDIHGAHRALAQCLERSGFDDRQDRLIALGDVCDRTDEVDRVIERLLQITRLDLIAGNHDLWALDWMEHGRAPRIWLAQGGVETISSYHGHEVPESHRHLLKQALPYLITSDNRLFIHGGFDVKIPLDKQAVDDLVWDRSLLQQAWDYERSGIYHHIGDYQQIYVGHTPTLVFGSGIPLHLCNLWAMDTGAGAYGRLSIMNIHTEEIYQSDPVVELYR